MQNHGYVYIIQSSVSGKYYIGSSINPEKRINEHNSGKTRSTKNKGPWEIRFIQRYSTIQKARKIEYRIKKLKRRDYVEKIILDQHIKIDNNGV